MIKNRQIIGIVSIIFVAFVGYKFVSSGIQENKEKAVLQEKYNLGLQERKPMEQCLAEVDRKLEEMKSLLWMHSTQSIVPGYKEACLAHLNKSSPDYADYVKRGGCDPYTLSQYGYDVEKTRKELEPEKQICYKLYK